MVCIERRERFSAAHQLYNPNWTPEQNERVFGKCANKNFHGHNFNLYVVIKGQIDPDTGFVMNLVDLSRIIKTEIIDQVDHKNLNTDVPFLQGVMASTENLVVAFWDILAPKIAEYHAVLYKLRLEETENNAVEYFGEKPV